MIFTIDPFIDWIDFRMKTLVSDDIEKLHSKRKIPTIIRSFNSIVAREKFKQIFRTFSMAWKANASHQKWIYQLSSLDNIFLSSINALTMIANMDNCHRHLCIQYWNGFREKDAHECYGWMISSFSFKLEKESILELSRHRKEYLQHVLLAKRISTINNIEQNMIQWSVFIGDPCLHLVIRSKISSYFDHFDHEGYQQLHSLSNRCIHFSMVMNDWLEVNLFYHYWRFIRVNPTFETK